MVCDGVVNDDNPWLRIPVTEPAVTYLPYSTYPIMVGDVSGENHSGVLLIYLTPLE